MKGCTISLTTSLDERVRDRPQVRLQEGEQRDHGLRREPELDGRGSRTYDRRLDQAHLVAVELLDEPEPDQRLDQGVVAVHAGQRCEGVARHDLGLRGVGLIEDRDEVERVAGGVRGVEDRLLDRRKREATLDQLPDQLEPLQVFAVVVARTPLEPRRCDQSPPGVRAYVADRHLGPRSELVDGEFLAVGVSSGMPES